MSENSRVGHQTPNKQPNAHVWGRSEDQRNDAVKTLNHYDTRLLFSGIQI